MQLLCEHLLVSCGPDDDIITAAPATVVPSILLPNAQPNSASYY